MTTSKLLFTYGYERKSIESFGDLVAELGGVVIDTRYNPISRRSEWDGNNIAGYFSTRLEPLQLTYPVTPAVGSQFESIWLLGTEIKEQWVLPGGERYVWVPQFGNVNYRDPRLPFSLSAPQEGLAKIAPYVDLTAPQPIPLILLCYEENPRKCHRRDVANLIAQRWGMTIMHLTGDPGQMAFF